MYIYHFIHNKLVLFYEQNTMSCFIKSIIVVWTEFLRVSQPFQTRAVYCRETNAGKTISISCNTRMVKYRTGHCAGAERIVVHRMIALRAEEKMSLNKIALDQKYSIRLANQISI